MINDTLNFLTWAAICACLWLVPLPSHAADGVIIDHRLPAYVMIAGIGIAVAVIIVRRPKRP